MHKPKIHSSQFGTCGLRGIWVGIAIFVGFGYSSVTHAATATQTGNWSDSATWGGSPPSTNEEDVVIPSGFTVTLDTSDEVGEVMVNGILTVGAGPNELICDSLIVMGASAEFEVGTDLSRYMGDFTLTLKGDVSENFVHSMDGQNHDMGARALVALMGGTINMHGEDRLEWTHLDATVSAGTTQITLSNATDWVAGDVIMITSSTTDWNEVETATVASVANGGLTVNLAAPLAHKHLGVIQQYTRPSDSKDWFADMRAEVGLLSRNITIQGAADSTVAGFGAHVMIHGPMVDGMMTHPSGEGYIKGVEIYRGGQKSLLARYPFHWHLVQQYGSGQYFSDSAVHESFNRGITIHGTDYTTVENNIFYDHIGHGVFLEDGSEFYNVIRYNVVALTKRPAPGEEVTPSDNSHDEAQNRTPASYWITNPNNTFEYNVAAGSEGTGYWFIFPTSVIGLAADLSYYSGKIADEQPLGSFLGNKAHSNMNGFDIFDRLASDHSIIKNTGWNEASDHVFDQNIWYANETALYAGDGGQFQGNPTQNIIHRDSVFVDNHHAFMLASSNRIEESVIVADSGEGLADYPRYFWRVYDGAPSLVDSYLVGWDASDTNFVQSIGAAHKRVNWRHSGVETDHVGVVRMELEDFDIAPTAYSFRMDHPLYFGNILRDVDGTLTGTANTSVVANHPWLLVGDETLLPNATNVYHSTHKFARITDKEETYPDVFLTRTNPGTKTEYLYASNGEDIKHQFAAIVNEDYLYTVNYTATPATSPATWYLREAEENDVALMRVPNTGNLTGLSVGGTAYTSVAEIYSALSTTTGYFLDGDGTLWIRFVADADGRASVSISATGGSIAYVYDGSDDSDEDGMTNDTEGGPGLDTDGDGQPDYLDANSDGDGLSDEDEVYFGLDPHSAADLRYEFGEYGTGGWQIGGTAVSKDVDVSGAMEVVNGSGGDPHIAHADYYMIGFPGNDIATLRVRYKANASGTLNLFWANTLGGVSGTRSLTATTSYTANSGYQETTFNVGSHSEWANQHITRIRLDTLDSAPNSTVYVDWIRAGTQTDLSSNGPTNIVYVDFGHGGLEDGSSSYPWNLLEEALDVVDADGLINITKGSGHNESAETFSGGGIISQQVTIDAPNGTVTIGTP